jgi:hypothetical protein
MGSTVSKVSTEENSGLAWLQGKKTYIVAIVTFVYSFVTAWHNNDWTTFAPYLVSSTFAATLRSALAKVSVPNA